MDRRSGTDADGPPPPPPPRPEPRQRWRITFSRDPVSTDQVGRAALEGWGRALAGTGLPLVMADDGDARPRIGFAAPLPAVARGERELIEIWLLERVPAWRLRETLGLAMPDAHRWVDAEDIWLGAPALAGQVAAADWRIELDGVDGVPDATPQLARAVATLTGARSIPRVRLKGTTAKPYDLRPLFLSVDLDAEGGSRPNAAPGLLARTRFDPELGSGRPEEVVAALADASGLPLAVRSMTRTRLLLADELRRSGSAPD